MIGRAVGGLAALGLIGGAGTVIYNNTTGDATVKITDKKTGKVQSITIRGGGATFSCPNGTRDKVEPHDIRLGRIQLTLRQVRRVETKDRGSITRTKLTLQQVRRQERNIEQQYPSHHAPGPVVDRYNALLHRDHQLVSVYNTGVDRYNAVGRREHRLVSAYNAEVDTRNAILNRDCDPQ